MELWTPTANDTGFSEKPMIQAPTFGEHVTEYQLAQPDSQAGSHVRRYPETLGNPRLSPACYSLYEPDSQT